MHDDKTFDLTQGGIFKKLMIVAVPIMGTQFMQMAYNLTDMFWLGRVSSDAVASSGTAGMYLWLSMAFVMVGRMGSEIGVSQFFGKGDEKSARNYSQMSVLIALVLGTLFALMLVLFSHQLISFFAIQESHVASDAANYLIIVGIAMPAFFVSGAITGTFNGAGNSRIPFYINAVGLVVNMILDPLFIIYMGKGIIGAAVATSTAQIVVCILFLVAIKKQGVTPFKKFRYISKPDYTIIKQIFVWTIPISIENMLFTMLSMIIARFVSAFGAQAISIQRVSIQIESLTWLIAGGFSTAVTAFVGQNFGVGKWGRIQKSIKISYVTLLTWGVLVSLFLYFGGRHAFYLLLPNPELVEEGANFLRILTVCQLPMCAEAVAAGAFRGMGKTMPPSLASIISNAVRVPFTYLLCTGPLGLNGVWWGLTLGACLRGIWIFAWGIITFRRQPQEDVIGIDETETIGAR